MGSRWWEGGGLCVLGGGSLTLGSMWAGVSVRGGGGRRVPVLGINVLGGVSVMGGGSLSLGSVVQCVGVGGVFVVRGGPCPRDQCWGGGLYAGGSLSSGSVWWGGVFVAGGVSQGRCLWGQWGGSLCRGGGVSVLEVSMVRGGLCGEGGVEGGSLPLGSMPLCAGGSLGGQGQFGGGAPCWGGLCPWGRCGAVGRGGGFLCRGGRCPRGSPWRGGPGGALPHTDPPPFSFPAQGRKSPWWMIPMRSGGE